MSKNINKSNFLAAYHTQFNIPEYLQSELTLYKRLNWSAEFFLNQWKSNIGTYAAGTIRRYNHIYHVNFCSGCSLGRIKSLLASQGDFQLILSFRKTDGFAGIVLVDFLRASEITDLNQIPELGL